MEKRYQVFVSSTFADLKDERQEVLRAILELDHMPAGMELFPATDDTAWQLIRDVIDASDYYVLIVGGRYGSMDEKGLSFTEREYDHAVKSGKPVIALLHQDPGKISRDKTETDEAAWKKLEAFRAKVEKKHTCIYWQTPEELKSKAIISLTQTIKRKAGVGWIRADRVPSEATLADILTLRTRIAELEQQLTEVGSKQPTGTEDLAHGEDKFTIHFDFVAVKPNPANQFMKVSHPWEGWTDFSWNDIFAAVAPTMITDVSDLAVRNSIVKFFHQEAKDTFEAEDDLKDASLEDFEFNETEVDTVIVQFRALGLIEESNRQRSVKDTSRYWKLTKYGDNLMTTLRAIRREPPSDHLIIEAVLEPKGEKK